MLLNAVLAWLHILGAVGWLGTAMLFGIILGPTLAKLSPPARSELVIKLFPRFLPYLQGFLSLTLVMGVALALVVAQGDFSVFSPTNPFGLYISVGAGLALVTVIVAMGIVVPSARKVLEMTKALAEKPGPPPGELMRASNKMKTGATAALILLFIVLAFMVAAANV
jgi:uncharacterized membrane protein